MPVPSQVLPLGSRLPWFRLEDLDGHVRTAADIAVHQPAIIAFLCNHSPYVLHIEDRVAEVLNEYQDRGVFVLAISPNDVVSYPSDDLAAMREQAARGVPFRFPYCLDVTQEVATAFLATCTPEFYVYDRTARLAYHGQFDDSRPNLERTVPVTGRSLIDAGEAVLDDEVVAVDQPRSLGCSVKWRSGNEPDYVLNIPRQDWISNLV